jgi:hypothetical protein
MLSHFAQYNHGGAAGIHLLKQRIIFDSINDRQSAQLNSGELRLLTDTAMRLPRKQRHMDFHTYW